MTEIIQMRTMLSHLILRVDTIQTTARELYEMESVLPFDAMYEKWKKSYDNGDYFHYDGGEEYQYEYGQELKALCEHKKFFQSPIVLKELLDNNYIQWFFFDKVLKTKVVNDAFRYVTSEDVNREPSTTGWFPDELNAMESIYKEEICRLVEWLRDIGTAFRYMDSTGAVIPKEYKDICGVGQLPLHSGAPAYDEQDFSDYAMKKQMYFKKDYETSFFSMKWQWLLFGDKASDVLSRFDLIKQECEPRGNEPEVLPYFGSNVNNKVKFEELDPCQERYSSRNDESITFKM